MALTARDLKRLEGVHPSLARVVIRASETCAIDFMVVEGVRSKEQMWVNYGKGRTAAECVAKGVPANYASPKAAKVTWLNDPLKSKHAIQGETGYGHAVDLLPAPYDWKAAVCFDIVAKAMLDAAAELGLTVTWGADWDRDGKPREKGEGDSPHFQIEA
jgi:peptidoglycan L-alanyl-D-glutamate endopeptidase CwlK